MLYSACKTQPNRLCLGLHAAAREQTAGEKNKKIKRQDELQSSDGTWNSTHVFAIQFFSCLNLEQWAFLVLLLLSSASVSSCCAVLHIFHPKLRAWHDAANFLSAATSADSPW